MLVPDKVRKGVGICIPLSGRPVPSAWAFALAQLDCPINFNHFFNVIQGRPVDEARNAMATWALENNMKYLFFLDEDTVPPGFALRRMIFLMENNPQMDVLGAIYCSKCETPAPLVFKESGAGSYWDWKVGELFPIWGIGMGCTLIRVETFQKIKPPYFLTIKGDASVDGVNYGEAWTEDLYFCEKLKQAGGKVFADGSIICEHHDVNTGKVYTLPENSKPAIRRSAVGDKKIIDLGCGQVATIMKEGTPVRCDLSEYVNADYRCDVRALPFANESFDIAYCMAEGSPVLTRVGFKYIEDIVAGDDVWTHFSRWKRVSACQKFSPQEKLFRVVTGGNPQGIFVTKNHPILGNYYPNGGTFSKQIYENAPKPVRADNYGIERLKFFEAQELSRQHLSVCNLPNYVEDKSSFDLAELLPANEAIADYTEVMVGHSAGQPWRRDGDKSLAVQYGRTPTQIRGWIYHDKMPFGYHHRENEVYFHSATVDVRLPRKIVVDDDLLRLIGYYLADGSLARDASHHVAFHFNVAEQEYVEDVQDIILDKFGISPTDVRQPKATQGLNLRYCSQPLHDIITAMVGPGGALDKKIPTWALWLKPELQSQLIEGFLRGDDTQGKKDGHCSMSTVSWQLAEGLRLMLLRNGEMVGLHKHIYEQAPEGSEFRGCGWIYQVSWTPGRQNQKGGMVTDDHIVSRVFSVEMHTSDLPVYGLTVEDDESYYASCLMHHNSSHTLEHFPREAVSSVLSEWLRVLKKGGELRLVVPDLEFAAKQILANKIDVNVMNVLYGGQDYRTNFHATGFTKTTLTALLESKGLKINRIWTEKPFNLLVSATKLESSGTIGDSQGRAIQVSTLPGKAKEKTKQRIVARKG